MALRQLQDMAHGDEALYDLSKGMPKDYEPPEYPSGLQFSISKDDLAKAGGDDAAPDATMNFSAMAKVTSVFRGRESCRVELDIMMFAGEDGKFFDLADDDGPFGSRPTICLCGPELEKLELEADCERGELLHLIGTVRVEHTASDKYGGDRVGLQIVSMHYEDESEESREG